MVFVIFIIILVILFLFEESDVLNSEFGKEIVLVFSASWLAAVEWFSPVQWAMLAYFFVLFTFKSSIANLGKNPSSTPYKKDHFLFAVFSSFFIDIFIISGIILVMNFGVTHIISAGVAFFTIISVLIAGCENYIFKHEYNKAVKYGRSDIKIKYGFRDFCQKSVYSKTKLLSPPLVGLFFLYLGILQFYSSFFQ